MDRIIINKRIAKNLTFLSVLSLSLINAISCRKLVESPLPSGVLAESNVYATDAGATAVLNGLYTSMHSQPFQGSGSIAIYTGLSADEFELYNGITSQTYLGYYHNALLSNRGSEFWSPLFRFVFKANAAIEGLNKSTSLTSEIKQQLLGEAKFMRAFYYFYLVNLFGDVPLALTTDPEITAYLPRSSKIEVYKQIITDLKEAEGLLSDNFLGPTLLSLTSERIRPTKWAAIAFLARVYLFTGEFANAVEKSSLVIDHTSLFGPLPLLNSVFLKNSREAIWQIQPTATNFNTQDAQNLIIPPNGPNAGANPVYLRKSLLNLFEPNDQRKVFGHWIDTTIYKISSTPLVWDTVAYANKYKVNTSNPLINNQITGPQFMTEYFMVFRLAEQYLIRAEARAKQNKIAEAQQDLNTIRNRAGLPNTTANDEASLLTAILKERQVELFCEWGHRWFDLKRTGKIDEVMTLHTPVKSSGTVQWQPHQALYPILIRDIQLNPNLVQNPGY